MWNFRQGSCTDNEMYVQLQIDRKFGACAYFLIEVKAVIIFSQMGTFSIISFCFFGRVQNAK